VRETLLAERLASSGKPGRVIVNPAVRGP
jgi:hypothetical protein